MYTEELIHTSFITITDPNEGFIEILEELPEAILNCLDDLNLEASIADIFPTSLSINIEGYKEDINEAVGQIARLLITFNVFNFHFMFHTLEQLDD